VSPFIKNATRHGFKYLTPKGDKAIKMQKQTDRAFLLIMIILSGTVTLCVLMPFLSNAWASEPLGVFDGYFWLREKSLDSQPQGFWVVDSEMDSQGNIFVVYLKRNGTRKLYANRYNAALQQWEGPLRVDLSDDGWPSGDYSDYPSIAIDNEGNAIVVYEQRAKYNNSYQHLYANRYNKQTGTWEGALQIDQFHPLEHVNSGNSLHSKIAFNSYGDALVVFMSSSTSPSSGKLNIVRFNKASNTWGGGLYDFSIGGIVNVVVDENGNWIIVLKKRSGGYWGVIALVYPRQTEVLSDSITFDYSVSDQGSYEVACDEESGKIVVTYVARVESDYFLSVSRYSQNLQTDIIDLADERWLNEFGFSGEPINNMKIKIDKSGNILLLYRKFDMGFWKLFGNYFNVSTNSWTSPFIVHDRQNHIYTDGFDIFLDTTAVQNKLIF